jgi:hypothetical protein
MVNAEAKHLKGILSYIADGKNLFVSFDYSFPRPGEDIGVSSLLFFLLIHFLLLIQFSIWHGAATLF